MLPTLTEKEIEGNYGNDLIEWRAIRDGHDPEGMFVGEWHRQVLLGKGPGLMLEEQETSREAFQKGGVKIHFIDIYRPTFEISKGH